LPPLFHYTAGVSSTLPADAAALYLLVRSWGYKPRLIEAALVATVILIMAYETLPPVLSTLEARVQRGELAKTDLQEIRSKLADGKRVIAFLYRSPFSWYGEGFVIYNASVPRLTDEYRKSRRTMFSASAGLANRDVDAYVIDKSYFPTADSVRASTNLTLFEPKPVTFESGDKLVELHTVFLLIRR
jgi:hypothetical protein